MTKTLTRLAFGALIATIAVLPGLTLPESLPGSLELTYRVSLGRAELGNLLTELRRDGDAYRVNSETRAEGLASILLGEPIRETCRFTVTSNELRPQSYEMSHGSDAEDRQSAQFDWQQRLISFSSGKQVSIPEGYMIDNCSIPFAFMLGGSSAFGDRVLHVLGGDRIRHFQNVRISEENLDTPLGALNTVRIEQQRVGRPDRSLIVWLAPDKGNLPVKIVERRKSRETTMMLTSVVGL